MLFFFFILFSTYFPWETLSCIFYKRILMFIYIFHLFILILFFLVDFFFFFFWFQMIFFSCLNLQMRELILATGNIIQPTHLFIFQFSKSWKNTRINSALSLLHSSFSTILPFVQFPTVEIAKSCLRIFFRVLSL